MKGKRETYKRLEVGYIVENLISVGGGSEEELSCKYVIEGGLSLICTQGGLEVFATYLGPHWTPPAVRRADAASSGGAVETAEFPGRLRRYRYGDLLVAELRAHDVLMVEVWRNNYKLLGKALWLWNPIFAGAELAKELARELPADVALDLAARIACGQAGNGPRCAPDVKRQIRESLARVAVEFPRRPFSSARLPGRHFDAWEGSSAKHGRALVAETLAFCNYYRATLAGGREGVGIACTANAITKFRERSTVAEKNGVYLSDEPLRLSAYAEGGELRCFDVGRRCAEVMTNAFERRGLIAYPPGAARAKLRVVKGEGYRAYGLHVPELGMPLLRVEVGRGRAVELVADGDIAKQLEGVLVHCDEECRRNTLWAVKSALWHAYGRDVDLA